MDYSPRIERGSEVGMTGGDDPEMRAPMRWDLVTPDNAALAWTKKRRRNWSDLGLMGKR